MSRLKAFLIHLGISIAVISALIGLVLFVWYPFPYDYFYSPWDALKIVLGVDLVIGPLLTFIIYDIKKKMSELRRDIVIIVFVQLAAFIWGGHVTYSSRPVFLHFADYSFYILARNDIDVEALKRKELEPAFWESPQLTFLDPPKDSDELTELYREYFKEGKPAINIRTDRFLPLHEGFQSIIKFSIDMDKAMQDADKKRVVDEFLSGTDDALSQYVFFPLKGTNKDATIVFKRDSGKIAGLIKSKI